uniref:Uncharacterized protein n=1 Tax=Oryza rufipogon TaxID=4529 RepID=A0A679BEC7_ORYRU|nr:hypothetical protein [Oryza rufipogon]BBF90017.1 hypothetical protein [Oryza rufipogon]
MSTVKLKRADTYKQELRACFFTKDMKDREAIIQRHREECKKTCRERHTYCPPEMPCCCMKNAPASSPSSVKNESGDGLWCAESPAIQHRNNHSFSINVETKKAGEDIRQNACVFDIV